MNTEKISVNVNVVDLGKIELLIEKGIYTNKTDFFLKAIQNELNKNEDQITRTLAEIETDFHIQIGKTVYDIDKLQKIKASNMGIKLFVVGRLTIEQDVPLQLAKETLVSIRVFGSCKMPQELKDYYKI